MNIIKILLIVSLLLLLILYLRWFRTATYDKLIVFLLLLTGGLFVVNPELTNRLANWLGVGRGADLLLYFSIVGFSFLFLLFYSKIKNLEAKITELTRNQALLETKLKEKNFNG
jgi:small membrane protein